MSTSSTTYKTLLQWLISSNETIPLIRYALEQGRDLTITMASFHIAINEAATWSATPEGHYYWEDLYRDAKKKERNL